MEEGTPPAVVKRCSGCQQTLPASSFTADPNRSLGLYSRCRACMREYNARYRAKHAERLKAQSKAYRERTAEALKAAKKRYHAEHREEIRERGKRYRAANSETVRAGKRRYYEANRNSCLERSKRWHEANPDRSAAIKRQHYDANAATAKARTKAWRKAHPEEVAERQRRDRARKLATMVARITPDLLAGKLAYWGGACWLCGGEPTTWDHVKPSTKGGAHILANLRPACQPCNTRKLNRWPFPTHRRR